MPQFSSGGEDISMLKKLFAATLLVSAIAFAPVAALADYHHHHHPVIIIHHHHHHHM
jgi:hypothetical protein